MLLFVSGRCGVCLIEEGALHALNKVFLFVKIIKAIFCNEDGLKKSRGERIRTSDPLNPIQVRYQAALHPDENSTASL